MNATLSALWYVQSRSLVNLVRVRLKRLRQPRYLIGAVIGVGYLWMVFFRRMFLVSAAPVEVEPDLEAQLFTQTLASAGLGLYVLMQWLFSGDRAALTFTEAELAFLLPAPVSRSSLLHFRLLRAQSGILFSTLFFNLVAGRGSGFLGWCFHGFTFWLVLTLLFLHSLGASFAIQRLTERGLSGWGRRLSVLGVAGVLVGVVAAWILTAPAAQPVRDLEGLKEAAVALASSGPGPWILAPFRWVVAPWFARDLPGFLRAAGPALAVLVLHYLWVRRAEVSFEEASIAASQKMAERVAAARSGNAASLRQHKARRDPFPLATTGFPPVALLWKNLVLAGPVFRRRNIGYAAGLVVLTGILSLVFGREESPVSMVFFGVAVVSAFGLGMSLMLGPQMARHDFRSDVGRLEVLKSMPLPAWQVVLGQVLAPVVILTSVQWVLMGVGLAACLGSPELEHLWKGGAMGAIAVAVAVVFPALDALLLLLPNAVAILMPGWGGAGVGRAPGGGGGVEVIGQRLLFGLGLLLSLVVGLIPGSLMGALVWWLAQFVVGPIWALPVAALPVALILLAEFAGGVWLLAKAFSALDVAEG